MYMDRVHRWARLHSKHNLITEFYEREPIDQIVYQVTKGGAHKKPRTAAATYYGVRWADSVVMPHHLPHFADWNYHPKSTQRCPSKLYGQAGRKLLLLVGWKESEEPSTDLPPLLIDQFKTRQAQLGAPSPPPPPRDAALPPLERQGVVDNPPFAWPTAWQAQEVLNRITLSTDPVHPDKDIEPTGEYTLRVERYPTHAETSPLEGRAHVYDRAGHWLGKITLEQLINLRTRFERTYQRDPKLFAKLNCTCDWRGFATELALLLQRWQATAKSLSDAALRQHHGTAHPRIVQALQETLGIDTELFAGPLHLHPQTDYYYSTDPRDQLKLTEACKGTALHASMSLITSRNKCNLDSTNIRNKLCDGYSGVPELHAPRRFKASGRRIYPGDPQMRLQTEADGRRAADALVQHFNHNPPLAYEPALAVYTDGSLQEQKEGPPLLGAGIYRPETTTHEPVYYLINPNGRGPTRTINRAELAAIYHALHDPRCCSPEEPLDIFTDSQVAIQLISKAIYRPHTLSGADICLHLPLLMSIGRMMLERAARGVPTRILKVKSHCGIHGNEEANTLAKEAARASAEMVDATTPMRTPLIINGGLPQ
ncbi:hypothetical protein N2152v2_000611 [Parachlorella kessleri]